MCENGASVFCAKVNTRAVPESERALGRLCHQEVAERGISRLVANDINAQGVSISRTKSTRGYELHSSQPVAPIRWREQDQVGCQRCVAIIPTCACTECIRAA